MKRVEHLVCATRTQALLSRGSGNRLWFFQLQSRREFGVQLRQPQPDGSASARLFFIKVKP